MAFWSEQYPGLITFIPVLAFLQDLIMAHFTLRYLRLSLTLVKLFTNDLKTQVEFFSPDSQQKLVIKLYVSYGFIAVLSLVINGFSFCGGICVSHHANSAGVHDRERTETCLDFVMAGFITDSSLKMLINFLQLYCLFRILCVSR